MRVKVTVRSSNTTEKWTKSVNSNSAAVFCTRTSYAVITHLSQTRLNAIVFHLFLNLTEIRINRLQVFLPLQQLTSDAEVVRTPVLKPLQQLYGSFNHLCYNQIRIELSLVSLPIHRLNFHLSRLLFTSFSPLIEFDRDTDHSITTVVSNSAADFRR